MENYFVKVVTMMYLLASSTQLELQVVSLVQAKSNQIARLPSPSFASMQLGKYKTLSPDSLNMENPIKFPFCTGIVLGACSSFFKKKTPDFLVKPWIFVFCSASTGAPCVLLLSVDVYNCTVDCAETLMVTSNVGPRKISLSLLSIF